MGVIMIDQNYQEFIGTHKNYGSFHSVWESIFQCWEGFREFQFTTGIWIPGTPKQVQQPIGKCLMMISQEILLGVARKYQELLGSCRSLELVGTSTSYSELSGITRNYEELSEFLRTVIGTTIRNCYRNYYRNYQEIRGSLRNLQEPLGCIRKLPLLGIIRNYWEFLGIIKSYYCN